MAEGVKPKLEWDSFSFCSSQPISGQRPSAAEVIIPPVGLITIILVGKFKNTHLVSLERLFY